MRVHVVALPHTQLRRDYEWCAYTAKVCRFVGMLTACGHEPLVYGPDAPDEGVLAQAVKYFPIVDDADRLAWFGVATWNTDQVFDGWDAAADHWTVMNARAALLIRDNWEPGDVIGIIAGHCQAQVLHQLADLAPLAVEWGIGYSGVLDATHKVYESHAWAHHVAGLRREDDIRYFDTVIPNCYDPGDFTPSINQGQYLLFMGRPTPRKGLAIVTELAQRSGVPVKIAGQPGFDIPGAEHLGLVTGAAKAELLAGALAVLTPTSYLEPFGGVAVEAMFSGTPVIATDWGAFTETVQHGRTGFRCRTLKEFLIAVKRVPQIDRREVIEYANLNYSTTVGARMYDRFLTNAATLRGEGWYTL